MHYYYAVFITLSYLLMVPRATTLVDLGLRPAEIDEFSTDPLTRFLPAFVKLFHQFWQHNSKAKGKTEA